ncbi:MAG: hypothetical protein HN984_08120, partial [Marinovum sp.]|nr:hypothetical protein [Marinovum sp.]
TETRFFNGANLAAIGDGSSGRWELLQFRDARPLTDKTFLLSHRLRGQLGSDALMPKVWPVGSYFVLLNGNPEQIKFFSGSAGFVATFPPWPGSATDGRPVLYSP